jgi:hypothetical protein
VFFKSLYQSKFTGPQGQTALTESIVRDLQINGISVRHISSDLFAHVGEKYSSTSRHFKKSFLEYFEGGNFPLEEQYLDMISPLHRVAIDEKLLKPVSRYLGYKCHLCYVELNRCAPDTIIDKELEFSQNYHRDPGIKNCVKIFIYFNDVATESGPFNFIEKTQRGGQKENLVPSRKRTAGSYYPSESELQMLSEAEPKVCTGRAGTVIFCDTTGWHFGGRTSLNQRKMSTFVYYPVFDNIKSQFFCKTSQKTDLSDLQKEFLKTKA